MWAAGSAVALGAGVVLARRHKDRLRGVLVQQLVERPAGRSSYADLGTALERGGAQLAGRLERAPDTEASREVARHIIGIERWGQARLRSLAGGPGFVRDEHRPYRPPQDASLSELRDLLSLTRAQTVALAQQLEQQPPPEGARVPHNALGDLSAKGWLRYLTTHASLESRRLQSGRTAGRPTAARS